MAVRVLHVCDKFGVRGSSIHGVSRLFSWWFPRFDRTRFDGVALRPQAARAGERLARRAGRPGPPPRPRPLRPAHPERPRRSRARARDARVLHVHGYAAADFGRVAARVTGRKLVLHEHFADPALPGYQALADRLLRGSHRRRDRGERLDARVPGARALRPARARAPHLERRAARRVRARVPRARARRARGPRAARQRASSSARSAGSARRRATPSCSKRPGDVLAAHAAARLLIVGDGDLMAPLREQAHALGIADRTVFAGHRTDVPDLLGALDVFCISSLYEGTPLALFEAMAAGKAIVSTAVDGCREVLTRGRDGPARPAPGRGGARGGARARRGRSEAARGARHAGARGVARSTTSAPASTRCRRSTTTCCGRAEAWPPAGPASRRSAREAWEVPRDLLLGRYPAFVTGGRARSAARSRSSCSTPPSPRRFARKLDHLARNGYVTLSLDEYVGMLRGHGRAARARGAPDLRRRARHACGASRRRS